VADSSGVLEQGNGSKPAAKIAGAAHSAAERGRLMDSALHVMSTNGYQGASVQDILDHAGLSTRAFYRQFRSKDDLLMAMFRTASEPDVAQVVTAVEAESTALSAVRIWVDEMVAMAFDPKRVRRLVICNPTARQTDGYEKEEADLRARLTAPLLVALESGAEDGTFPETEPKPDADIFFDLVWSVARPLRGSPSGSTERERATEQILRFCLPALGVGASPAGAVDEEHSAGGPA
jgi:AcrR family transcriptional regulator